MRDITTVVDAYFSLWNESDAGRRQELIAATFTEDARYVGPLIAGTGHDGIADMAHQLLSHLDGHQFKRTGDVDSHHGFVRYAWEIVPNDGPAIASGTDFGSLAADGRIASLTTFLDLVPEGIATHR